MGLGEGNDGEAADSNEGGILEEFVGFDLGQGNGIGKRFAGFDFDLRFLGVGGVDGDNGGGADGPLAVAGFVDDELCAGRHLAEIFYGSGIGDAVPDSDLIALEISEGVFGGFGLEQIVGRHEFHLCCSMLRRADRPAQASTVYSIEF